ncbi:ribonuclease H-like domain-containing protein [Tanacetum coccineum]
MTKAVWDAIETIFQDNKRTRTISLKGELRVIQMGDQTVDEYFSKIEAILTLLTDLAHKDPFPDLAIVRSMVAMEELRLRSWSSELTYWLFKKLLYGYWLKHQVVIKRDGTIVNGTTVPQHVRCVIILDVAFVVGAMLVVSFMTPLVPQLHKDSGLLKAGPTSLQPTTAALLYSVSSVLVGDGIPVRSAGSLATNDWVILDVKCIDVDETFSLVVKPATIRTVLSLALSRHWPVYQLDVKNAFLHGSLSETRSLYGLKQAPRAWFQRFAAYAARVGFIHSRCDTSLFIYRRGSNTAYLLLYVDDIILTASSIAFLQSIIATLHAESMLLELLERMLACSRVTPCRTSSVDTVLSFLLMVVSVSVPTLCQVLQGPFRWVPHYMSSILSGYCVFLGNNLLSWSSKRQVTLSRSSAKAEYRGVANAVAETCWLRNLLRELHTPLSTATLVYCDNVSAVYLSSNPVQHQRTKHIEIDIHFLRDLVAAGHIRVLHVPSRYQYADVFIKGLHTVLFDEFRSSLSVRSSPAQTAGGC